MSSAMSGFLRFLGEVGGGDNALTRISDSLEPETIERRRVLEERQRQRDFVLNDPEKRILGTLNRIVPNAEQYLQQGGDIGGLGALAELATPQLTKFEENLQTLQQVGQMSPEMRELYSGLFGKGGVNVNVGGQKESPFEAKFKENLGKQAAEQIGALDKEAKSFGEQSRAATQALKILESNPDINISPFAPIGGKVVAALSPYFTEDQLKNVADYQTLDAQLISNRFAVLEPLKGALTEKEQEAGQTAAGTATGTKEGLVQTLKNNEATGILRQDYAQRMRDYIQSQGENYSPTKFEQYYKQLGEEGKRPTLNSLIGNIGLGEKGTGVKAGSRVKWSDF